MYLHKLFRALRVNAPFLFQIVLFEGEIKKLKMAIDAINTLTLKALNFFMKTLEAKVFFFHFLIIMNVFVSFYRFVWIPMFWVYDQYKYFTITVRGLTFDIFRRQILTTRVNPHAVRINPRKPDLDYSRYPVFLLAPV